MEIQSLNDLLDTSEFREAFELQLTPLFAEAGFGDVRRLGHDVGYATTFALRKTPAPDGSCGRP